MTFKSSVPVVKLVIGVAGIEPATFPSQTERATAALHTVAERVGFEPTDAFTSAVFKTAAINHSATSPK